MQQISLLMQVWQVKVELHIGLNRNQYLNMINFTDVLRKWLLSRMRGGMILYFLSLFVTCRCVGHQAGGNGRSEGASHSDASCLRSDREN